MSQAMPPQPAPPPYQLPPGYQIKRKKPFYKRVWFWLLIIIVVIIVIVVTAVSKAADDAVNKSHTVVYKIEGTGKADITYFSSDGSDRSRSVDANGQKLPWSKTVSVKGDLSGFALTATPSDLTKKASLKCSLAVDDKVVSTSSSSTLVTCSGSGYDGK